MPRDINFDAAYRRGPFLGRGAFSQVFTARDRRTGRLVAVKTEHLSAKRRYLRQEYQIYQTLHRPYPLACIPHPVLYARDGDYDVMVMERLGPSLQDRMRDCGGILSNKSICMIALQLLSALQRVHARGVLHCDLKPDNVLTGLGRGDAIFLADFGMARRYYSKRMGHVRLRRGVPFAGTIHFAAVRSHLGLQLSRRDDLESLGYVLLYMHNGRLPWGGLKMVDFGRLNRRVRRIKEELTTRELSVGMSYMQEYFDLVLDLRFRERPDYSRLRRIFRRALQSRFMEDDRLFDWVVVERGIERRGWLRRYKTMRY